MWRRRRSEHEDNGELVMKVKTKGLHENGLRRVRGRKVRKIFLLKTFRI